MNQIPTYEEIMLPLLHEMGRASRPLTHKECAMLMADAFQLSLEQRQELLPSGTEPMFKNRVGWAIWYLNHAKFLRKESRGQFVISDLGKSFLANQPKELNKKILVSLDTSSDSLKKRKSMNSVEIQREELTPLEQIESANKILYDSLADDLLDRLKAMNPYEFEQVVIDLLFAMGYGGSREETAKVTRKSNDEGIDGIISQDRLGLDMIYVQAKKWQGNVGRVEVQNFVGALAGKHASKGIILTTSDFNKNAIEYAQGVSQNVILVNGTRLAELMIEHNVGVSISQTIQLKKIDSDYFDQR